MTRAPHPGILTLPAGELYVRAQVHPADPHQLQITIKPLRNIDQTLLTTPARPLGRATVRQLPGTDTPELWLGTVCIPLHHATAVQRAQEWCEAYAAWIAHGELPQRGAA
jgi:hypothetical protein